MNYNVGTGEELYWNEPTDRLPSTNRDVFAIIMTKQHDTKKLRDPCMRKVQFDPKRGWDFLCTSTYSSEVIIRWSEIPPKTAKLLGL